MIPGQRPSYMTGGHGMSITQRPMRSRPMYSQSPQGHSPMQGFIPQQNVQYQVVGQVSIIDQCSKLCKLEIFTYVHQFLDFSVLLDLNCTIFVVLIHIFSPF